MSYRRPVKGVHQLYADRPGAGERWITCACGAQWRSRDVETIWLLFWQHTQHPPHK